MTRCPVHDGANACDCDLSYWVCRTCGCDTESYLCSDDSCHAPKWERLAETEPSALDGTAVRR